MIMTQTLGQPSCLTFDFIQHQLLNFLWSFLTKDFKIYNMIVNISVELQQRLVDIVAWLFVDIVLSPYNHYLYSRHSLCIGEVSYCRISLQLSQYRGN